ncbi:MAG TPA: O-methyltransferase [Acidimicrobiales bacterium]|nr:O-methyltransferase [Acidimicrobiales bacterium]
MTGDAPSVGSHGSSVTLQAKWSAIDDYISDRLVPTDDVLEAALAESDRAGLPQINVARNQGRLLELLATMIGARSILEIGTLGGYSTIFLARALPAGGRLVTLEFAARHAEVARANLDRAGLADVVEVRVGPGVVSLERLASEGAGPFDMVFIDADKESYPQYFAWAMRLVRPGGLIVADNVVRGGAILDAGSGDPLVAGIRGFYDAVAAEPRARATAIQTVGTKGHDGLAVVVVAGTP